MSLESETRPEAARFQVRDWIPAFAGMTEGFRKGLRRRESTPGL